MIKFNKKVLVLVSTVGLLGVLTTPSFASGTTASQSYTVTLTAPSLGLAFTPASANSASLPIGDMSNSGVLSANQYLFDKGTQNEEMAITNTGNISGSLNISVSPPTGMSLVATGGGVPTVNANQLAITLMNSSSVYTYFNSSGTALATNDLTVGQSVYLDPQIEFGAGTSAGTYTTTFNYTLS